MAKLILYASFSPTLSVLSVGGGGGGGGGAKAIVLDSTASQIADATAAWVMEFVQKQLRREGKTTTKTRYSPGYGDLSLAHQSIFFELLHLEQLGMKLTESFMMMPEKSVTAICGVETIGV